MADYINIRGQNIEVVASDPANPTLGQIWYNSTSNTLKGGGYIGTASWATAPSANTARYAAGPSSAGTQTAMLAFGGEVPPGTGATEEYDGSTWTNKPSLNTPRTYPGGAGTVTAALAFSGYLPAAPTTGATESWNGSSWTNVASLSQARYTVAGTGTQTSALCIGGSPAPGVYNITEEWSGSSWSSGGALNTARGFAGSTGTEAAALCFFGYNGTSRIANVESYDGTSWTAVNSGNTARNGLPPGGAGTQTAALAIGGSPNSPAASTTAVEEYDGISWAATASLPVGKQSGSAAGTTSAAIHGLGYTNTTVATAEEYTGAGPTTVTITAS